MVSKKIYAYSTDTYLAKSWVKVGETIQDDVTDRINQQDGTSNPEPLDKHQRFWPVPDSVSDKKVHKILEQNGHHAVRLDKSREWYECTFEDVAIAVNSLVYGIARPNSFPMRQEQQDAVDQAALYFQNGGTQFLINAKMRFGKTFASYQLIKKLGYKNVLIMTYKPAVEEAWREDLEKHVDFEGWVYSSGKGFQHDPDADVNVIFASFQDINDFDKSKWKGINGIKFDLIVVDEMHYGSETERAKLTMNHIKCDRRLYVSGTPLDAIISGKFSDDEIYTWSYADEQAKRRVEKNGEWKTEVYRWLPEMEIHTFSVCDEAKRNVIAYSEDEQFTMTKMFGSTDGEYFNDEASVKLFLDQVFGRGVRKNKSPFRTFAADHTLWVLPPNVLSANAMCKLLDKMVGDEYHIINVAGNNIHSLSKVKKMIAHYDKTITVTVGRFNTGVTVPEWDAVLMLNDGKAPETYFQTIFRVQSPNKTKGKEKCFVFDFNPERVLELVYTYAELVTKGKTPTATGVRQFLEFCPVMDHSGNTTTIVDAEDVLSFISESGSLIDKFTSNYLFNKNVATSNTFLLSMVGGVSTTSKKHTIASNLLDVGKNFQTSQKVASALAQKKLEDLILEKAKLITSRIPEYITFVHPAGNINELTQSDPTDFEEHFEIPVELFEQICYNKFINTQRLNRLISSL